MKFLKCRAGCSCGSPGWWLLNKKEVSSSSCGNVGNDTGLGVIPFSVLVKYTPATCYKQNDKSFDAVRT